jgi:toxin ParE1/3/4
MRRRLRFSVGARSDFAKIARWSEARWGVQQRVRYVGEIRSRLDQLRERPQLGPELGGGHPHLRKLSVGSHVVLYRFDETLVFVIRILDQRMDIQAHLDERGDAGS